MREEFSAKGGDHLAEHVEEPLLLLQGDNVAHVNSNITSNIISNITSWRYNNDRTLLTAHGH